VEPLGSPFKVLVIDDGSPEETRKVTSRYFDSHPVRVLSRKGKRFASENGGLL